MQEEEVLVAVDGSERSDRIVDYASDFAKRTSLPILLVYVVDREQLLVLDID